MTRDRRSPASPPAIVQGSREAGFDALLELLQAGPSDATELFSNSLGLLVERLDMDLAMLTRITDLGYEVFWWRARPGFPAEPFLFSPVSAFYDRVLSWPQRTLVIRDARQDPAWRQDPAVVTRGVESFLGAPLWEGGEVIGTLGVQGSSPRDFKHGEVALVAAVAKLLSKTLEIEDLKSQLQLAREALELSSAVVEDSALQSNASGLPNRHYLDVWMKANLTLARRNRESMSLMLIRPRHAKDARAMLESLRGADLMVDMGDGNFLLVLPGTQPEGVPILHARLEEHSEGLLGAAATQWQPEEDDLHLRSALQRLRAGLRESIADPDNPLRWSASGEDSI
ncbi:MAG: GAF domain-containing protein [Acidobacteria bacterium]|nr:GAF domain-containing protein [Acidobacteriota bacterium]